MIKLFGPYTRKDNRQIIVLWDSDTDTTTTKSYPRYVLEQAGHTLLPSQDVHHKDKNPLNNNLDNLEIIDKSTHTSKHNEQKLIQINIFICEECQIEFERPVKIKRQSYCSRSCSAKVAGRKSGKSRNK